jgi:hypothetical protein
MRIALATASLTGCTRCGPAVAEHGRAAVGDVGGRKAGREIEMHAGLGLDRFQRLIEILRGRDHRAAGGHRNEERHAAHRLRHRRPPGDDAVEPARDAPPGLGPVDMRIGAERGEQVGVRNHRVRHVDVQIKRADDRHILADHRADAAQQLALGVVVTVGDHGAVQLAEDHVGAAPPIAIDQRGAHALEGLRGDRACRLRHGPGDRDDRVAALACLLDEAGQADVQPGHRRQHRLTLAGAGPGAGACEILPGRGRVHEGRAFVHEAADRDAKGHVASSSRDALRVLFECTVFQNVANLTMEPAAGGLRGSSCGFA